MTSKKSQRLVGGGESAASGSPNKFYKFGNMIVVRQLTDE
jgi:hypothetical protein